MRTLIWLVCVIAALCGFSVALNSALNLLGGFTWAEFERLFIWLSVTACGAVGLIGLEQYRTYPERERAKREELDYIRDHPHA